MPTQETAVHHVGGLHCATEKARVERALGTQPAVLAAEAAPRETSAAAIRALREQGVRAVMLSGDSRATSERIAPLGFVLRPEVAALSMSGSSIIVAVNAVSLKRPRLP